MIERWRDIRGYEGIYQISDKGNVKSFPRKVWNYTKPGRMLKMHRKPTGYLYLSLTDANRCTAKHVYVHRLVAEAFVDNPYGYTQVNHKDLNKSNNDYTNLEWVTSQMNIVHFRQSKLAKKYDGTKAATLRNKSLNYILENKERVIAAYDSGLTVIEVSKALGLGRDRVSDILKIYGKI